MNGQLVYVIVGPTASGKTGLSLSLAPLVEGEVISADSRQVYRGLNIGTGKVTRREQGRIQHHLLDVASPSRVFTAHDYALKGRTTLTDIISRGHRPIICGGTGFYIDALLGRIDLAAVERNPALRKELSAYSTEELFSQLEKLSPARAARIDKHNPVRLIRAIEIARSTSSAHAPLPPLPPLKLVWIGIDPGEVLSDNISVRLRERLKQGMIAEVKRLHEKGLSWKRMEELGLEYRYLSRFVSGKLSRTEAISQLESEIKKYAKRQRTYWRRNSAISWFSNASEALAYAIDKRKEPASR